MLKILKRRPSLGQKTRQTLLVGGLITGALVFILKFNQAYTNKGIESSGGIPLTELSDENKSKIRQVLQERGATSSIRFGRIETIIDPENDAYLQLQYHQVPGFTTGGVKVLNEEDVDTNNDGLLDDKEIGGELDKLIDQK